jgi:hypothetical protein
VVFFNGFCGFFFTMTFFSTSSVVRDILSKANKPQRMSSLFQAVSSLLGQRVISKTHFRESVIAGMFHRGELIKKRVIPMSSTGKVDGPAFFVINLAPTSKVRLQIKDDDKKLEKTLQSVNVLKETSSLKSK